MFDELGVNLASGVGADGASGSAYHPAYSDVMDLVHQCRADAERLVRAIFVGLVRFLPSFNIL